LGSVIVAWQLGLSIGEESSISFSILSNLFVVICSLIAFVNPKVGLSVLVFQCMYTDEFKRIAVVEAGASMDLVQTILIGPLVTILAMNISIFMKSIIYKVLKVDSSYWKMIAAIFALTVAMLVGGEGELSNKAQFALNVGLYLTLLPLIGLLLPTIQEWQKFILLQLNS
jgi:hypothetical protein